MQKKQNFFNSVTKKQPLVILSGILYVEDMHTPHI